MSTKSSLKNRIKKANATQEFFNSYETDTSESTVNTPEDKSNDNNETYVINDNNNANVVKDKDNNDINDENIMNKDVNLNTIIKDQDVLVVDNKKDDDYLRELALGKKPKNKKTKKVFTSFYMDPDLAIEVDKIAARGEKGDKSKLINMGIRKLLEDYGVIEPK
ncbi:hypothetical protein [Heyndrickxia acidicola]|uniref:Uncharacterized protein n=1 Tax=Heyndrickxia acidicola TaxID=209389 RepID=A0ABU6MFP7_9BACI|nr:hypothetical protein [Heyndrickxia acidicola]MED1203509.1 hypothetical protein [Heyndrickxia acidicola]